MCNILLYYICIVCICVCLCTCASVFDALLCSIISTCSLFCVRYIVFSLWNNHKMLPFLGPNKLKTAGLRYHLQFCQKYV